MLNNFFKNLAVRLYNENDLSDVTWSLAQTSPVFLEVFMEHFGFKVDGVKPISIERERMLDLNNRPDFCVINGDKKFIIESKLNGTDYHIQAYSVFQKTQNIAGFALIVNHAIDHDSSEMLRKNNWTVSQWEDFKDRLETGLAGNRFSVEESLLVRAYINFIKGVCGIMEIKKMVFDNLISLYHFNRLMGKLVSDFKHKDFACWIYNGSKPCGESYSGVYFCIQRKKDNAEMYPWFGIYFGEEPPSPSISISFSESWCPKIYKKYKTDGFREMFSIFKEDDDNEVVFELTSKYYGEFINSSVEGQKALLVKFLNAVIDEIKNDF